MNDGNRPPRHHRSRSDASALLTLADKLIAFYREAVIDWRTPLADGTLAAQPMLARHALQHAIDRDDAGLTEQLAPIFADLGAALAGSAIPTDYALRRQKFAAAAALLESGAPVAPDSLVSVSGDMPPAHTICIPSQSTVGSTSPDRDRRPRRPTFNLPDRRSWGCTPQARRRSETRGPVHARPSGCRRTEARRSTGQQSIPSTSRAVASTALRIVPTSSSICA
ncbi:hypothetical protein LMG29660_06765 [Burkholderia puraquae]|uniref:Uncharacterized protein n=2 Tax=Burkholderia puraquae TaxID=1904757 RepID=A0A6J5EXN2_9BURK|nr:hypothetical protein LMG29660_06765 [Burkholderia puraquae]